VEAVQLAPLLLFQITPFREERPPFVGPRTRGLGKEIFVKKLGESMKTHQKATCVALAASLTFIVMAGLVPAASADDTVVIPDGTVLTGLIDYANRNVLIPAGSTTYMQGTVCIKALQWSTQGAMLPAPGGDAPDLQIVATQSITVTGSILGRDGTNAAPTTGLIGQRGGDGSTIRLAAPTIHLGEQAQLVPGNGGNGSNLDIANMGPSDAARAGDGGDGGFVFLLGSLPTVPALYGPARLMGSHGGLGGGIVAHRLVDPDQLLAGISGHGGGLVTNDQSTGFFRPSNPLLPYAANLFSNISKKLDRQCDDGGGGGSLNLGSVLKVLQPSGPCDGVKGGSMDASGLSGHAVNSGTNGSPGLFLGGAGGAGDNGESGGDGGTATGQSGTDGCILYGCGGDGGDATANGGSGSAGGNGGNGGDSTLGVGGDGGSGGSGGSGGNAGRATPGVPGASWPLCPFHGIPGVPGSTSAIPGRGAAGGTGGHGGHGLEANGSTGSNGSAGRPGA
jgi:hypothetical protein